MKSAVLCVICGLAFIGCTALDKVGSKANYDSMFEISAEARAYRHADGSLAAAIRKINDKRDESAVKLAAEMAKSSGNSIPANYLEEWAGHSNDMYLKMIKRITEWLKKNGVALPAKPEEKKDVEKENP